MVVSPLGRSSFLMKGGARPAGSKNGSVAVAVLAGSVYETTMLAEKKLMQIDGWMLPASSGDTHLRISRL
jgi:hypothetical protein